MIGFDLTGGEKGDAPHFPILLDIGPDIVPRAAIGDKGDEASRAQLVAGGLLVFDGEEVRVQLLGVAATIVESLVDELW